jgi:predicted DNA-binding transcriptional regulator AlpA
MMDKLLTPDDVAQVLQVSRRTAYRIMHQMPHIDTPFRVAETELRVWLGRKTVDPSMIETKGKAKTHQRAAKIPLVNDYHIPRRRRT